MVRRLTSASSHAFMIEVVFRSTGVASQQSVSEEQRCGFRGPVLRRPLAIPQDRRRLAQLVTRAVVLSQGFVIEAVPFQGIQRIASLFGVRRRARELPASF